MQFGTQQLEAYLAAYNKFQSDMEEIDKLKDELKKNQNLLANETKQLEQNFSRRKSVESEKETVEKQARREEKRYSRCMGENFTLEYCNLNEYTDPEIFEETQKRIEEQRDIDIREYCDKKKNENISSKEELLKKQSEYNQDKTEYIHHIMQQINGDCVNVVEKKKENIIEYLNANQKIKNTEIAKRIKSTIEESTVTQEQCAESEKSIITRILSLKGTENYCRTQKFDLKEFRNNRDKFFEFGNDFDDFISAFTQYKKGSYYESRIFYPFFGALIIGLFALFMLGFAPWYSLIPSGHTIASVGSIVLTWVVRAIIAGLIGCIVAAVIDEVTFEDYGAAGGLVVFIALMVLSYFQDWVKIPAIGGIGNFIHYSLLAIISLLAVIVAVGIVYLLVVNTPIAAIFFKTGDDKVLEDLNEFEEYFNKNKKTFIQMFHYEEVIGYAVENGFYRELKSVDDLIDMYNEKEKNTTGYNVLEYLDGDYLDIVRKYESKLNERQQERNKQIAEIEQTKNRLREKEGTLTRQLRDIDCKINSLTNSVQAFVSKVNLQKEKIKQKEAQIQDNKKSLLSQTKILTDERIETFDSECKMLNTASELLKCNGQLSKYIYFVRKEKDKNGMAQLIKMDLNCQHTVFVYDDKDILGNNLSEELCHFIKWLIDAVRRSNSAVLINRKVPVIDMLSGKSILNLPPYNKYVQVITDNKEKTILVDNLKERENAITSDIEEKGVRVDDFDGLNSIKMSNPNNLEVVAEQTNIAIEDLWEKPYPYHFIVFIVPTSNENGSQPAIIDNEFKSILMNVRHYGIIPIFIISSVTWNDSKNSPDAAYLHNVQDKKVFNVYNVGVNNETKLDIKVL